MLTKTKRRIFAFTFIGLFLLSLSTLSLALQKPVVAAPAVCYLVESADATHVDIGDCSDSGLEAMVLLEYGEGIQPDHCYRFFRNVITASPGKFPLGSAECNNLAAQVESTSTAETKCWTLNGPIEDYDNLSFLYQDIAGTDRPCTDAQNAIIVDKYTVASEPGYCYVFSTIDTEEVRRETCSYLFLIILASNDEAQDDISGGGFVQDVDREDVANCDGSGSEAALKACLDENPIVVTINTFINMLAAGTGVIIVLMIVLGGIQYSTAGANPQAVNAAKSKIVNAILALLMFLFMYTFLQWLVPGGIFG